MHPVVFQRANSACFFQRCHVCADYACVARANFVAFFFFSIQLKKKRSCSECCIMIISSKLL